MTNETIRLTGTEYRLLDYLRDPMKSRYRGVMAEAVGCHPHYITMVLKRLSEYGIVSVKHGPYRRLSIEVIENP